MKLQTMQFWISGKSQSWCSVAALGAGHDCKLSDQQLLVNCGAQCSILPAKLMDTMARDHGPQMDAANGMPIHTYGTWDVEVCFRFPLRL